jgi:hypothetical protein
MMDGGLEWTGYTWMEWMLLFFLVSGACDSRKGKNTGQKRGSLPVDLSA